MIGDTVNTAARIEGLGKLYDNDLFISRDTYNRLSKTVKEKWLFYKNVELKGKEEKLPVYVQMN